MGEIILFGGDIDKKITYEKANLKTLEFKMVN